MKREERAVRKWLGKKWEEIKFAARGLVLASREKEFWLGFVPTFLIFGVLMNLLSGGFAAFNLMGAVGFPGSLKIIGDAFWQIFGFNRNFIDWLGIFLITVLQSLLVGMLVVAYENREKIERNKNSASLQNSGIVAGLALIGSGCPTCGTALLTPLLTTLFSSSGVAIAGKISAIITWLAILLALWTLKKLGYDCYVIIISKKRRKHAERD